MLKYAKNITKNADLRKKILIIYTNDMKNQDLLNDIFMQLFDEIRLLNIIDASFVADLQYIIKEYIDNNFEQEQDIYSYETDNNFDDLIY